MNPAEPVLLSDDIELTNEDILDAMAHVPGYIDVTTEDFRELYHLAYRHALTRRQALPVVMVEPLIAVEPPRPRQAEILLAWVGAFLGIAVVAAINHFLFAPTDLAMMIGSLGATAVLLFAAARSPLAQPRNLIGGHIISAIIGVASFKLFHDHLWLAESFAVATAIGCMQVTRTLHPPGGATALIAVIGSTQIHELGFLYVLVPATVGPLIMLGIALLVNNTPKSKRWPEVWF